MIASSQDNSIPQRQVGERLVVDAFARYRITDPLKFYQTVGPAGANSQLAILLNSALRRVLGEATLADVVRNKRERADGADARCSSITRRSQFGIQVVDVRIRRADLPEQNSQAVYQRMQTERQREAAEFRAQGSQKSQEIRAKADRDVTVLVGRGQRPTPRQIRGQGDGERNRIFAEAYNQRSGLLRLLPLDAGLREEHAARRHPLGAAAGFRFLPLFRRSRRAAPRRRRASAPSSQPPAAAATPLGRKIASRITGAPAPRSRMSDFLAALGLFFAIEGICLRPSRSAPSAPWPQRSTCRTAGCASPASFRHWSACSSSGWCAIEPVPGPKSLPSDLIRGCKPDFR